MSAESSASEPPVRRLLRRLDLEPGADDNEWIGHAAAGSLNGNNALFGGLVVAQVVIAAGRVMPGRVHSVHQSFLRRGEAEIPLRHVVDLHFVGRTYASASVSVWQGDHVISHAQVATTQGIDGPDRQVAMPPVDPVDTMVNRDQHRGRPGWEQQPIEFMVNPQDHDGATPDNAVWIRAAGHDPGHDPGQDPLVDQALLGYASDRVFLSTAWKPHAATHGPPRAATLSHSLWFHRPVDMSSWHAYFMDSPALIDGRGLIHGQIFTADGQLVASTAQEATFRSAR